MASKKKRSKGPDAPKPIGRPIGKCTNVRIEDGVLIAEMEIWDKDWRQFAEDMLPLQTQISKNMSKQKNKSEISIKVEIGPYLAKLLEGFATSQQILFALQAIFENVVKIKYVKQKKEK